MGGSPVSDGGSINAGSGVDLDTPLTVTITLSNSGDATLTLGTISAGGDGTIAGVDPSGTTLAPGASAPLVISMDTSVAGAISSAVIIPSDDAASPFDLTLTGSVSAPEPPVVVSTTNMLRIGSAFLSEQRHANTTEPIIYRRGAAQVELSATVGRINSQEQTLSEFVVDAERVDFIVRSTDLVLSGSKTLPIDGDEIEYDAGAGGMVYSVRRDELDRVYRPVDEFGGDLRVHTARRGPA